MRPYRPWIIAHQKRAAVSTTFSIIAVLFLLGLLAVSDSPAGRELASATKSNALQHAMVLWDEVAEGQVLAESNVREIVVLGRRGPAQAAFTNPELLEMGVLERSQRNATVTATSAGGRRPFRPSSAWACSPSRW